MDKFYRVKKDTFLWKEGAVLKLNEKIGRHGGYAAIEDVWDTTEHVADEYISAPIVEDVVNAEFFERVYLDTIGSKMYRTKKQVVDAFSKAFK